MSNEFSFSVRLQLLRTYVTCHLLQNAAVAPRLPDSDYYKLRAAYMHNLRKVTAELTTSMQPSTKSDEQVCSHFKQPTYLTLYDRARLNFLRRLLIVDTPAMQAVLAADTSKFSVWSGMFSSLQRLRRTGFDDLAEMPPPTSESLQQWIQFVLLRLDTWKTLVRRLHSADPPHYRARVAGLHEAEEHPDETTSLAEAVAEALSHAFPCDMCTFVGKSKAGLAMHRRRKHNAHSDIASRIRSPVCPACNLPFENRHRAIDHMRDSPRCKQWVLANVSAMSPDELAEVYAANRGVNVAVTREYIPKAGRKPPGVKPPMNAVIPAYSSDGQRAASVRLLE
eukprot:1877798-Amphidinium_carterae.1